MTEKLSSIIEQVPLIEELKDNMDAIIGNYSGKNKEITDKMDELQQTLENTKKLYEEFMNIMQKSILVRIGNAWTDYVSKSKILDWDYLESTIMRNNIVSRAVDMDTWAIHMGYSSANNLRAKLQDNFFIETTNIYNKLFQSWVLQKRLIKDYGTVEIFGEEYKGQYLLSEFLDAVEDQFPKEIQNPNLRKFMQFKERLKLREEALVALGNIPMEFVTFYLYTITVQSEEFRQRELDIIEKVKALEKLEMDKKQAEEEFKKFKEEKENYTKGINSLEQINKQNERVIEQKQKLQDDIVNLKNEKEQLLKDLKAPRQKIVEKILTDDLPPD